jgi:RecA/RadA recombinase
MARTGAGAVAPLAEAIGRLEERYGNGVVLPGGAREEWRALRTIPFGIASLDALLEGGVVAGEPQLLLGAPSSGATTLALALAASAQGSGGEVAWLDPLRCFDPLAAARGGVDLARLLLIRGAHGDALAFAASVVARSSAFVLVVLDLGSHGPLGVTRADAGAIATVVARARAAHVALVVVSDRALGPQARSASAPLAVLELRRVEWLTLGGRIVGWRSEASRLHARRVASLAFAPLALPPRLVVDEGLLEFSLRALA